jgi:hypothetical protein
MSQTRFDALVKLAAKRAWDPAELLDGLTPRRPFWLTRKRHALIASQLLRGERAALAAAERLRAYVPVEARAALDAQIAEERRHVDAQARYSALLGDDAPASPALGEALAFLARPDLPPVALALANNLLLEEEALHLHRTLADALGCPALGAVTRAIDRDEHRHVLLGRLILPALLAPLDIDARIAIYRALKTAWVAVARALLSDHGGLLPVAGRYDDLESRWAWRRGRLVASGLLSRAQAEAA